MKELKTLTLNGNTYDSFVDQQARDDISQKISQDEVPSALSVALPTIDTVAHGLVVTVDPNRIEVTEAVYQNLVSIAEQGTARIRFLVNYGPEEDPYPVEFTQIAHILKIFEGEAYGYNWFITTYDNEITRMALYPDSGKYYLEGRLTLLARQQ